LQWAPGWNDRTNRSGKAARPADLLLMQALLFCVGLGGIAALV